MGLSTSTFGWLRDGIGNLKAAQEIEAQLGLAFAKNVWYVDAYRGSDTGSFDGKSWANPFDTIAEALDNAATGDAIVFRGDVREEVVGSNLKFDITIIGALSQHHPDQPGSGSTLYDTGASMWRAPASPTATTPLLEVRGRGWKFINIAFDCPVDAAAVKLVSNASSGTSEYDGSHATFINCSFQQGKYGIEDNGGCANVTVRDCHFRIMSPTGGFGIINTSTSVRLPQYWRILDSVFAGNGAGGGNEGHIDAPLSGSVILRSVFGVVEGTALYIDLTGGDDNIVAWNTLGGTYDTTDYVAGTNDIWSPNYAADGLHTAVPS